MKSLILILIFFSSSFILAGNIEIAENETETSTVTTGQKNIFHLEPFDNY